VTSRGRVIAIDPDTRKCGYAHFNLRTLVHACAVDMEDLALRLQYHKPSLVVCEMPQQYGRVGDQRDFLALARVVGNIEQACVMLKIPFEAVTPQQWKGQTPKNVCTLRTWEKLDRVERAGVEIPKTAQRTLERGNGVKSGEGSDVLDAIGIGLWRVGRLHL